MAERTKTTILPCSEAENYIESLETFAIEDIGCKRWFLQHERLAKLNLQAILNAKANEDEYVKECFVSTGKIKILIFEAVSTNIWKENVFPQLLKLHVDQLSSIPVYTVLYHEGILVNLLETVLYHQDALESISEFVEELIDYCYRKCVVDLIRSDDQQETEEQTEETTEDANELLRQKRDTDFGTAIKALIILCFICEQISCLPLSAVHQLLNTLDVPMLLISILQQTPWIRRKRNNDITERFVNGVWQDGRRSALQITKEDGLVWISITRLLLDQECQRKYEINDFKKGQLLKLRGHIKGPLLDQIPCLGMLREYLEKLSILEPPPAKCDLIIVENCSVRDQIIQRVNKNWKNIAANQAKNFFSLTASEIKYHALRMSETYQLDVLEQFMPDKPRCATCGETATKKCLRCLNEWYCQKECQVQHWPKHKKICNITTGTNK